jgi:RNA polymerase sigma-70 factor (ECF subfamily)
MSVCGQVVVQSTALNCHEKKMDINANKELEDWMVAVADNRCKRSYASLFKHFANKVKRAAYKQLGQLQSEAIAMEATQEVMTQVWRKAHLYHPDKGTVTTWIYTITRNVCFDMLRKVKNKTEINLGDDIWPLFDQDMSQEDVFRDHLHDQRLLECVKSLPEKQHQIVHGVFFLELSQEQLARKLNIPLGTVKSRLRLAMQKLRQELGEAE